MPASEITLAELLRSGLPHGAHRQVAPRAIGRHGAPRSGIRREPAHGERPLPPGGRSRRGQLEAGLRPHRPLPVAGCVFAASFNGSRGLRAGRLPHRLLHRPGGPKVIEANKDRPFFLYLAHWAPHTPLQATREDYEALSHIENHRERVYAAMIRALDRGVGPRARGVASERASRRTRSCSSPPTTVGAHYIGLPEVNRPYRGWKISTSRAESTCPTSCEVAGAHRGGLALRGASVHHFDTYATAAAAAGAPCRRIAKLDGVDLVPFVRRASRMARPTTASSGARGTTRW